MGKQFSWLAVLRMVLKLLKSTSGWNQIILETPHLSNSDPSRDWFGKIAERRNCWRYFLRFSSQTRSDFLQLQSWAAATCSARQKESNICSRVSNFRLVIATNSQIQKYSLTPAGPFWFRYLLTQSDMWHEDRKWQSWFPPSLFLAQGPVIT